MNKNKILIIVAMIMLAMPMVFAAYTLRESVDAGTNQIYWSSRAPPDKTEDDGILTWNSTADYKLAILGVELKRADAISERLCNVSIHNAVGGVPFGAELGRQTAQFDLSVLTANYKWYNFTMPNITIINGGNYSIMFDCPFGENSDLAYFNYAVTANGNKAGAGQWVNNAWVIDTDWVAGQGDFQTYSDNDYVPPAGLPTINVTITTPEDNYGFNASRLIATGHKVWINVSFNVSFNQSNFTCGFNSSGSAWSKFGYNTTVELDGYSKFYAINNTALDGRYNLLVRCNDTNILINSTDVLHLTVDTSIPSIAPLVALSNNNTFIANSTLSTQINFTDDQEIWSINVTFANGSSLFYDDNLAQNNYQLNISRYVDETINNWLDIRVCDAHTATEISAIQRIETTSKTLKYVIEDKPLLSKDRWVSIYPKLSSEYTNTPMTSLFKDRYTFAFSKTTVPLASETFIVESTEKIEITKLQAYDGHLIIPSLNRWIDFENDESTKTEVKQITDYKVEVTVYGLKSKTITFNSIGELNCVETRYYFGNLNPIVRYTNEVLAANTTTFYFNVTEPTTLTSISAKLWYNNTYYALGTEPNYTQSITLPSVVAGNSSNLSFNFVITANGVEYNTTYLQQNVSNWFLDGCTSYTTKSINFTLKNELNNSEVLGSLTGNIFYSVGSTTKTFSFTPTNVYSQQLCVFPSAVTFDTDYSIYYSGADYPQRRYYSNDSTIMSAYSVVPLYLLPTAYGMYIRFQVVDSATNIISGVQITAKTLVSGSLVTVEQENTDDSGLATFFLNPDVDYTFTFEKTGYTTTSFSLRPTSSEIYYVTMGGGLTSITTTQPMGVGISYIFNPNNQELQNATNYTFSFNLTSSYWDVTACTLYLKNSSQTLTSSSTTWDSDSCDIAFSYNTGNQTSLILVGSYTLNGTLNNVSQSYGVSYYYEGSFSLKNFIDDITSFSDAGFNDNARMFIAFIVILAIVALAAKNAVLVEPEHLVILTMALIFIFSFIGWLVVNDPLIRYDGLRKYGIFIITSLLGSAYLIKRYTE